MVLERAREPLLPRELPDPEPGPGPERLRALTRDAMALTRDALADGPSEE